jgi:DNA-binding transcriptional ArsR family regulator
MGGRHRAKYEARAAIVKALAHPARLMIVDELAEHGQRCVCELTDLVGTDLSTVSRHLSVACVAGLLVFLKIPGFDLVTRFSYTVFDLAIAFVVLGTLLSVVRQARRMVSARSGERFGG